MIPCAVMVPHPPIAVPEVGRQEIHRIEATERSYERIADIIAAAAPQTIVIFSPHATMYRDYFNVSGGSGAYGDLGQFNAGAVSFEETYDEEMTELLTRRCREAGFPAGTEYDQAKELDHGTMVPLYFIRKKYRDFRLVRIGLSGLPLAQHYRLGMILQQVIQELGRRTVIVASGDLSHCQKQDGPYGFRPQGPEYDQKIMATMSAADFGSLLTYDPVLLDQSMECGHRSFCLMAGTLDGLGVSTETLSHEATFGVGYGFVSYQVNGPDESRHFLAAYEQQQKQDAAARLEGQDAWVHLAADTISEWVLHRRRLSIPAHLPQELMTARAGVFVSIHEHGELRGCIGTILPTKKNAAEEIIANAISACSRDPRFEPVGAEELAYLELSVDELKTPELIQDRSQLEVHRYGVICSTADGRRGLLLPDLEGVDTVDEQIRIACRKGDIDPDEDVILQRFEVIRHA